MKTLYTLTVGILLMSANISTAQIAETNDIQPMANQEAASDEELSFIAARYYYYPNMDAYFDSQEGLFIYDDKGQWTKAKEVSNRLPRLLNLQRDEFCNQ